MRIGLLQSGYYGVPQSRWRMFILAADRREVLPMFPLPTHAFPMKTAFSFSRQGNKEKHVVHNACCGVLPFISLRDAIEDLPRIHISTAEEDRSSEIDSSDEDRELAQRGSLRGRIWGKKKSRYPRMERLSMYQSWMRRKALEKIRQRERNSEKSSSFERGLLFPPTCGVNVEEHAGSETLARTTSAFTIRLPTMGSLPPFLIRLSSTNLPVSNIDLFLRNSRKEETEGEQEEGSEHGLVYNHYLSQIGRNTQKFKAILRARTRTEMKGQTCNRSTYIRMKWDGTMGTVLTSARPLIHPNQPRLLTPRENARLQGFPDHVHFHGDIRFQYAQIGNAVPPPLAQAIGNEIVKSATRIGPESS
jgi:site-specific DNA-cytosine methylase